MPSLEDLSVDQLLAHAKGQDEKLALFEALGKNPETRETLQRAIKKLKPDLVIPEIDSHDKIRAEMEPRDKKIEELEGKILERDIRDRLERQKAEVKAKYRLTDADFDAVEKIMVDEKVSSYDIAARLYRASSTPSTPTPASYSIPTYEMPEKDIWGKGIGNKALLDKIAMNEAASAMSEIMSGKVAGLGPSRQ